MMATEGLGRTAIWVTPAAAQAPRSAGRSRWFWGREKLGFNYVLSERADVVVGRDGGPYLDGGIVQSADDLDHYHGVELVRDWIAGVHPGGLFGKREGEGRCLGRANGVC